MKNKTAAFEADLFNFQLKNAADECGFKADDSWIVKLVDEVEMNKLRSNYIPSVVSLINPKDLVEVYKSVKLKLKQIEEIEIVELNKKEIEKLKLNYIIAYNEKRAVR